MGKRRALKISTIYSLIQNTRIHSPKNCSAGFVYLVLSSVFLPYCIAFFGHQCIHARHCWQRSCHTGLPFTISMLFTGHIFWHWPQLLRFTELQKSMNDVNSKTITKHLRVLEKYKIITRTVYPEVPP